MFEYMNKGILVIGTVIIIATLFAMILRSGKAKHENRHIGFPYLLILFLFIIIGVMLEKGFTKNNLFFTLDACVAKESTHGNI